MADDCGADFFEACAAGDVEVVLGFLAAPSRGFLDWRKPGTEWTALHVAVEMGQLEVVRILLAAGVLLEERNAQGWTPLCLAVDAAIDAAHQDGEALDLEIVKALLDAGARVDDPANEDASPIALARRYRCPEVEELLERKG